MGETLPRPDRPRRKTTNFGFACYLDSHKIELDSVQVKDKKHFEFYFVITDDEWNRLSLSWHNSESRRFDDSVKNMKQFCDRYRIRAPVASGAPA